MEKSIHSEEKSVQQQSCGIVMLFMCFAAVAWVVVTLAQGVMFLGTMVPGFRK